MISIAQIVSDLADKRGSLKRNQTNDDVTKQAIADEYQEVWDCFNRYLSAVLAEKKTLSVTNFCKIGWQKGLKAADYKPYFGLSDGLVQAFSLGEAGKRLVNPVPSRELSTVEEFNFSKAAIKFSNGLTKDQIFTGMRFIVQAIGSAMSQNKNLQIDFDCGRLSWSSGKSNFSFREKRSLPETPQENIRPAETPDDCVSVASSRHSVRSVRPAASRQELAYREALKRHLSLLEYRAGEAIRGRQDWESHIYTGLEQEASEFKNRKKVSGECAKFVNQQILWNEAKRTEDRRAAVAAASAHAFPGFSEPPESDIAVLVKTKQEKMREALDLQIQTNNALRDLAREKEKQLDESQRVANMRDMQTTQERERQRREEEKRQLAESWNREVKIKHIWKAIEDHATVPPGKSPLLDAFNLRHE